MTKKLILSVEDEKNIQDTLRISFSKRGYDFIMASNGEEGVAAYISQKPSVILTDIRMPKINGMEFISFIRKSDKHIPIIVLTGYPDSAMAITLFKDFLVSDILFKPIAGEVLFRSIEDCLSRTDQNILKRFFKNVVPQRESTPIKIPLPQDQLLAEYKTIFAALAHDLKNELTHLSDACNSLIDLRLPHEEVKNIKVSLEYSLLIIRRIYDYLNIGPLPTSPINVIEVIHRAVDLIRPRLGSHIEFNVASQIGEGMGSIIVANSDQLLSILVQLVRNAQDALGSRDGTIDLNIQLRYPTLAISISDNGPGIPLPIREMLFRTSLPRKDGTGLGLYLAHKIISSWNGQIYIEKTGESGTTITISLPISSEYST